MVELVNKLTGSRMFVDEARAAEYLAAGHKPAAGAPSGSAAPAPAEGKKGRGRSPKKQ